MSNDTKNIFITLLCAALLCIPAISAIAGTIDILPASAVENAPATVQERDTTHNALKLTPDKSELVRLTQDAASVIVGNPAHLSVLAESSKLLVFIPRQAGATYVTVLGQDGSIIMQRHVIIASPKEKYIRIRQSCTSSSDDKCQETQVFYCPDMCHAIAGTPDESSVEKSVAAGQVGGAGSGNAPPNDEDNTESE